MVTGLILSLLVASGGCVDASSDPTAVLMAPETRAALHLADELPSLPELARRHGAGEGAVLEGVDRWIESWGASPSEGRRLRDQSYALVAPGLAQAMSDGQVAELLRDVDEAVSAAEDLESRASLPAVVTDRLRTARLLVDDGVRAREEGARARAVRLGLAASDRLRSLTPRRVALGLVERAEEALRRNAGPGSYTPEKLRRADRLVRGAHQALEEGDPARAVRRAFYACQVLGLTLP